MYKSNNEQRFEAFCQELEDLCKKHRVYLCPDQYDILQLWHADSKGRNEWYRYIENCLGDYE